MSVPVAADVAPAMMNVAAGSTGDDRVNVSVVIPTPSAPVTVWTAASAVFSNVTTCQANVRCGSRAALASPRMVSVVGDDSSVTTRSSVPYCVAVAGGAALESTKLVEGSTAAIGTSRPAEPSPFTVPRCTETPHSYSTTDQATVTGPGLGSSVTRRTSTETPPAASDTWAVPSAGSFAALRTDASTNERVSSTAVIGSLTAPLVAWTVSPD